MFTLRPRQNSSADIAAFDRICERLGGFDPQLSFERVDGFLTALAAGPHVPDPSDWLPALCGDDTFERVFADPEDHAQALRVLQVRLKLLCELLDPERLFDQPDQLRLEPWVLDWSDDDRRRLIDEDGLSADEAAQLQLGSAWADGFLACVHAFAALWAAPPDGDAQPLMADAIAQVAALTLPAGGDALQAHVAKFYANTERAGNGGAVRSNGRGVPAAAAAAAPLPAPSRDDLLTEACFAVQELRMLWVDFAPRPDTRRVAPTPGRNEPCFCGSGKKYKKCHGAAAA